MGCALLVQCPGQQLRELTCHIGSLNVTCHPAEVTFLPLPQPKRVLDLVTLPCILPGSLNQVLASAGVKAGMSPLPDGR